MYVCMYKYKHILDAESNSLVVEVEGCSINVPSSLQHVPQHRAAHALVVVGGAATAHAQACHRFSEVSALLQLDDKVTVQGTLEKMFARHGHFGAARQVGKKLVRPSCRRRHVCRHLRDSDASRAPGLTPQTLSLKP
jgi:hypothetical protein